jgi:CheY-like chemotaxis protein
MRILLVDDNEMNLDMLSRRLERKGHSVATAINGRTAMEIARRQSPELILLDMSLPDIGGLEVARHLKAGAETATIPIVALTAYATEHDRSQAISAGCDDFDTKPVDLLRLLGKIAVLTTYSSHRESEAAHVTAD